MFDETQYMMKRDVLKVRKRRNSSRRPYGKILEAKNISHEEKRRELNT